MQIIRLEKTALDGKTELPEADIIVRMSQREYSILNFLSIKNDIEVANANRAAAAAAAEAKKQ